MYVSKPNLIIGFHGCEKTDQIRLLNDIGYFKNSREDYDWLGHGMYFWENNPDRAMHWAEEKKKATTLREPAVVGAVIEYTRQFLENKGELPFDSIRAVFVEGDPIYPDAGFNEKSHIQICIINPNCVKGIFLQRKADKSHTSV